MTPYELDTENGTITYKLAPLGQEETIPISELLELLFWLKSREHDIRNIVHTAMPIQIYRSMTKHGEYYYGVTKERQSVRIAASRWQEVRELEADKVRAAWAFQTNERRELARSHARIQQLDRFGQEMYPLANETIVTPDETPDYLVHEHLMKLNTPDWWVIRADNLDLGKYIKLP